MSALHGWARLGAAALLAGGLASPPPAAAEPHNTEPTAQCLPVPLADGSALHVPRGANEPSPPAPALLTSEGAPWSPRRPVHKRRTQVFDARTPGAIAAVRG